ncbi:MAG: GNAT family N-acetyltransferase [Chloroflexota bacterium]|nr:MAG: N-acetyltransferase [Chloroflexota bacterium]
MSEDQRDQSAPIISIVGDEVTLGPFRRDLLSLYHRWTNDFEVLRTHRQRLRTSTLEATEIWYEAVSKGESGIVDFLVSEKATMRPIGYATLDAVDHFSRTATFGILLGEKECWGRGYGTETTRLMLGYGFGVLGLHNIDLTVVDFNSRGIRACERAGFRVTGRRREAWRLGDRLYDLVSMECLATEFAVSAVSAST